jgi:dinuclear metal center YbgI/SA1388 family protein
MSGQVSVKDIHEFLCRFAPPSLAEDWDNVGLQKGSLRGEVKGILVSLDVTQEVLEEAKKRKANLLVTHHPLFFRPLRRLKKGSPTLRLVKAAERAGIHILSFHTNLDSTREGLNDLLASQLGLQNVRPLVPSKNRKLKDMGLGRVGKIPKTSFMKFARQVSRALRLKDFRIVGADNHPVRTVAVMTGSGAGYFREAKRAGADVLVTGDVKYHTALDALSEGIALVDIGHFAGEIGMVPLIAKKLEKWFHQKKIPLKIFESKVQSDPFRFIVL